MLHRSLIVKSQQNRIELVTRPGSSQPLGSGGHRGGLHPALPLRWFDRHPEPGPGPGLGTLSLHTGRTLLLQLHRHRPSQRYQDAVEIVNWGDIQLFTIERPLTD